MFRVKDKIGMTSDGKRISYGKPPVSLEQKRLRMISAIKPITSSIDFKPKKPKKHVQTKRFKNCLAVYKKYFQHRSWYNSIRYKRLKEQPKEENETSEKKESTSIPNQTNAVPVFGEITYFSELKMKIRFSYEEPKEVPPIKLNKIAGQWQVSKTNQAI
jgi:hypothetical protein